MLNASDGAMRQFDRPGCIKKPIFSGKKRLYPGISLMMILMILLSACTANHPATKVAERFFDAVGSASPQLFHELLSEEMRMQFETAMSEVETEAWLVDARSSLEETYGANWRKRIRVRSVEAHPASYPEGALWVVHVDISGEEDSEMELYVFQTGEEYWLDLGLSGSP